MNTTIGATQFEVIEDRPEVVMTRTFNAPRDLVFQAHSSCEHVSKWWGPRRHTMAACEMDFVEGGAWRFVLRSQDGQEFPFSGRFGEIRAPERLTWTFVFDVEPFNQMDPAVETIVFTERDGRTTLTVTSFYPSMEVRDAVLASGMSEGAAETWDRLEEYVTAGR